MNVEIIIAIISACSAILAGGGGLFVYLNSKQKNKQDLHSSSVQEWKELYDEMRERLDAQEEENKKLRNELIQLKQEILKLNTELNNYKKFDNYIKELEYYNDLILGMLEGLVSKDAFANIINKKPQKVIDTDLIHTINENN